VVAENEIAWSSSRDCVMWRGSPNFCLVLCGSFSYFGFASSAPSRNMLLNNRERITASFASCGSAVSREV
jgi:hypothetical protein